MELYLKNLIINLLFLFTILHLQGSSSGQECPYPCFPPPTGPGNNPTPTPTTTTPVTPPSPPQGGMALYPPPASYNNPPGGGGGGGVIPYYPPPAGGGDGDGGSGMVPPPPEPIVSWFPYYFRKPPHPIESSSIALRGLSLRTAVIAIVLVAFSMCSVLY